jgi:hypothetical protein
MRAFLCKTLLVAGPALELVDRWRAKLQVLRRRSPSSDAVGTLSTCVSDLVEAIERAKDARLHLTIADAHATSRIPVSTLALHVPYPVAPDPPPAVNQRKSSCGSPCARPTCSNLWA